MGPDSIVHPPGEHSSVRSASEPPLFIANTDLYAWRKAVADWVDYLRAGSARGLDKYIKTKFETAGRYLYQSLPSEQKLRIDHAQLTSSSFDYRQDDQVEAVQQIVDLIAKDPPTTVVTRLIDSFVKVQGCRRRKDQAIAPYVSKFVALASKHLIYSGATSESQVGEVMAITLLNNANLDRSTHQTATMQMIQTATQRLAGDDALQYAYPFTSQDRDELVKIIDFIRTAKDETAPEPAPPAGADIEEGGNAAPEPPTVAGLQAKLAAAHAALGLAQAAADAMLTKTQKPDESDFGADGTRQRISIKSDRCPITLEDAIAVVRSLEQHQSRDDKRLYSERQIQGLVNKALMANLRSMGIPTKGKNGTGQAIANSLFAGEGGPSSAPPAPNPRRRNQPGYCRDCGKADHRQGDMKCKKPNFETRKRRKDDSDKDSNNGGQDGDKNSGNRRVHFLPAGSRGRQA